MSCRPCCGISLKSMETLHKRGATEKEEMKKASVAVLISGSGSNLQALMDACAKDDFPAGIALVISNKADAYGLMRAQKTGIETKVVSHKDFSTREDFDNAIHTELVKAQIDFVCLAGFMRLLSAGFVEKWAGRILNIHPSLLPEFPGLDTHARALAEGKKEAGCTVHLVTADLDAGPILLQAKVAVEPNDTPETLAARVLEQEHRVYPAALKILVEKEFF